MNSECASNPKDSQANNWHNLLQYAILEAGSPTCQQSPWKAIGSDPHLYPPSVDSIEVLGNVHNSHNTKNYELTQNVPASLTGIADSRNVGTAASG